MVENEGPRDLPAASGLLESERRLDTAHVLRLYRQMFLIRSFEEQVLDLYLRTLTQGAAHVSIGQEAIAVGVCEGLTRADYITSTHRGHGHCLAKGARPDRMFAELLGRVDGYCRGKGGSMHIADPETGNLGANAIVGGSLAIAAGAALSARLRKTDAVVACFFGDGALNQGLLLESMNMAAIWHLPLIYVCEHNQYGEYTPTEQVTAGVVQQRGEALGIPSAAVDGMDVLAVHQVAQAAVARARSGEGPSFLVCETYRYLGHGISDHNRAYRTRDEEELWKQRDPIQRLAAYLTDVRNISEAELDEVREDVSREVLAGVEFGLASPLPLMEAISEHVYDG
jgi:acetoin:2,6-dichlorophenolindophenol oxidoreductase subunit alpha